MDQMSRRTRDMRRLIYAGAMDAQLDRQGRVVVSPALIEHAGLGHEVIVAGLFDHAEVWDRAAWRARIEEVQNNAELVAEHLAEGE
jgi:MraZ protein